MPKVNSSSGFYKTLSQTIPFGLQIMDATGKILYANEYLRNLSIGVITGRKCWDVKDDQLQCSDCPLKKPVIFGKTIVSEVRGVASDRVFQIHHTGMVFKGNPAFLEIFQDVTERKQAEETIRKLSTAVEQSPAAIVITDVNGDIEYVNYKFTQVTGYSFEEVKGKNPRMLNSGKMSPAEYKDLWGTILNKREWRGEFQNRKKNGELYWESALISPILNEFWEITHFIAIKEDITTIKKAKEALEHSEKRYRSLFENMLEGYAYCEMIFKDNRPQDFVYLSINNKFTELTGLKDVIGKRVSEVIPGIRESNPELFEIYGRVALTGIPEKFEVYIKALGIWTLVSVYSLEKNYFVSIFDNITERKQAEESLKKMTSELIEKNSNLEQFAYIISHNLRSPVANIIGISNALQDVEMHKDEQTEMTKGLLTSVKKLDEVILDLNKTLEIKQGAGEKKEKILFSEMLEDIKNSIASLIKQERADIKSNFAEIDEMVTQKSYMHSIFYNLISNSIKYRQPGIPPIIDIKSRRIGGKTELFFKDNGIGIDLLKKGNQIFGLYKRFHTHTEGKGMGLFMTKTQVETLGGKISIKSEVDMGTEFKNSI